MCCGGGGVRRGGRPCSGGRRPADGAPDDGRPEEGWPEEGWPEEEDDPPSGRRPRPRPPRRRLRGGRSPDELFGSCGSGPLVVNADLWGERSEERRRVQRSIADRLRHRLGDAAGRAKVRTGAAGASQLKSFTRETPETTALTVAGTGDFVKLSGVGGRAGRARAWPTLGFAPTKQHRPAGRCLKHRPVGLSRCIECDFAEEGILRAPSLHQKLPQCGLLLALLGRALRLGRRSRLGGLGGGLGGLSSGLLGSGHGHRFLPKIRTPFEHSGGLLGSPRGEDRVDLRTRCTATQVKTTGDIRVAKAARHPIRRKEAAPTVAVTECEPLPGVRHVRQ